MMLETLVDSGVENEATEPIGVGGTESVIDRERGSKGVKGSRAKVDGAVEVLRKG